MNFTLSGRLVIAFSFFISMALTILPIPDTAAMLMPSWTLLVLMYWCIALPQRVSVGTGWLLGILMDILSGSLLGLHALIYSLGAYLSHQLYPRLRNYPVWQQAGLMLIFLIFVQTISLWLKQINNNFDLSFIYWTPAITGALCWPVMFALLRFFRRHFRVQ